MVMIFAMMICSSGYTHAMNESEFQQITSSHISSDNKEQFSTGEFLSPFLHVNNQMSDQHDLKNLQVIPGGQTIGVKLKSDGMMVVGFHPLNGQDNKNSIKSPAKKAQIEVGDMITHVNEEKIYSAKQLSQLIAKAGKQNTSLSITLIRQNQKLSMKCKPQFDSQEQSYRIGIYVRDVAVGIGTMTFYSPEHRLYGALGHIIADTDTKLPIPVGSGQIVDSQITSILKSQHGEPGEKIAQLHHDQKALGNIEKNTPFGIFGQLDKSPENRHHPEQISVATQEDAEVGPAQIYTVIDGQKVEKFDIEIIHKTKQTSPSTKGLVIKITDPRLLEKTGGIVQGMSGSPIIQNGKLIGAVTHVFVNDPQSGYGCYIEWMLQDAGIYNTSQVNPDSILLEEPKAS